MSEMKICPNCGKEILAVAKKCKYCGTWIAPKHDFHCPVCCEVIPEDSIICPVCHERLRPDPEPDTTPTQAPDQVHETAEAESVREEKAEKEPEKQSEIPAPLSSAPGKGKKWIIPAVIAALVAGMCAAVLLLRPSEGNNSCYNDAKVLHQWFFSNLGTHVNNLSSIPELETRLTKLLGAKTVEGVNRLLENSSFNDQPNVGVNHEVDGTDVYTLIGIKNSDVNDESFVIKYIDYGECGYLDATTMIGGSYKAGKETLEYPGIIHPLVTQYEYNGRIGYGRNGSEIKEMTLWVDGPGVSGNPVRGYYQISGIEKSTLLSGFITSGNDDPHLSLSLEENVEDWFPPQFELKIGRSLETSSDLTGTYVVNFGHSEDSDNGSAQGIYETPVRLSLEKTSLDDGNPAAHMKYYSGRILDSGKSVDITMVLKITGEGVPGDAVSGYYTHSSSPDNRIWFKPSLIDSYHGSDWTLDLVPRKENECITFNFVDKMTVLSTITGNWARMKDGKVVINDHPISVEINDVDGN